MVLEVKETNTGSVNFGVGYSSLNNTNFVFGLHEKNFLGEGKKVRFDRDKLERSVQIALRKRPVDNERVDRMISGIVRRVESLGETEVSSDVIGEIVMEGLQSIDSVAYVRFASVYKNFREAKDFEEFLGVISSNED